MYDGDSAGLHAAIRAIGLILKEGMNPRVVFLPDGDDPDSFSRKHTLEEIREYIATHEQDGIAFKTDLMLKDAGNDPLKKANLINEIADTVALIPDAIKRQVYVDTVAKRFEIEADIIQDRVRKTRENNRHTARREDVSTTNNNADGRNAEEGTFPSAKNYADATGKESSPAYGSASNKGRLLEPSEKELLGFILRFGRTPLQFESDSEFYDPEGAQTVAEFIDAALAGDDIRFANNAYQAAYDAYFTLYDQGLEQDAIVLALLNGEDRAVATVTADLSTEKYELTVHNFTDALTTTDSWLVNFVPRAILAYHDKRLQARQEELKAKLSSATPEEQLEILTNLGRINEIKKTINIKLGRLKK